MRLISVVVVITGIAMCCLALATSQAQARAAEDQYNQVEAPEQSPDAAIAELEHRAQLVLADIARTGGPTIRHLATIVEILDSIKKAAEAVEAIVKAAKSLRDLYCDYDPTAVICPKKDPPKDKPPTPPPPAPAPSAPAPSAPASGASPGGGFPVISVVNRGSEDDGPVCCVYPRLLTPDERGPEGGPSLEELLNEEFWEWWLESDCWNLGRC